MDRWAFYIGGLMNGLRYLSNVTTLLLDSEKCTGCKMCINVCPHDVFVVHDKKAELKDRDACMECGACAKNCAFGAITVKSGVGCASGILSGFIRGTEPTCGCSQDGKSSSCC
jgi:ferredoxin